MNDDDRTNARSMLIAGFSIKEIAAATGAAEWVVSEYLTSSGVLHKKEPSMSQLIAYRVPPQQEFKAARELRENGFRAYVPRDLADKRRPPMARGYVFSGGKHAFARHVRTPVGPVKPTDLSRLYIRRPTPPQPDTPFAVGDAVRVSGGPFDGCAGRLKERRGHKTWLVIADTSGQRLAIPSKSLVRIDPG